MNRDELVARLRNQEDNFVERKPAGANASELRKTIVAFANSVSGDQRGLLFVGVADDGTIKGCPNTDEMQKTVRRICEQQCYPPIAFESEVLSEGGLNVLVVIVPPTKNGPHFAGRAYVRRGSESVTASPEIFERIIWSRSAKVAAIVALKDQIVTVEGLRHMLGKTKHVADERYRESAECRVVDCDAHVVKLSNISTQVRFSEPIDNVRLMHDDKRNRPMLIVTGY